MDRDEFMGHMGKLVTAASEVVMANERGADAGPHEMRMDKERDIIANEYDLLRARLFEAQQTSRLQGELIEAQAQKIEELTKALQDAQSWVSRVGYVDAEARQGE